MLRQRVLTVVVVAPVLLLALWAGGIWLWLLVAAMAVIGFDEYARMWAGKGVVVPTWLGSLCCLALVGWAGWQASTFGVRTTGAGLLPLLLPMVLTLSVIAVLTYQVLRFAQMEFTGAAVTLGGIVYIGLGFAHVLLLRRAAYLTAPDAPWRGLAPIALAFFCTWANDIFAYIGGVALGKHRLAPLVSPKKSWEGFVSGLLAAALVGALFAPLLQWRRLSGLLVGALIAVAATFGDLAESSLKRHCGVKDSGKLLPGHGGVLDRLDSSLFVLPLTFYLLVILANV